MAHGAARPTVSRRREIGSASARSLLMTILGEFVLPRGGSVWTQALVSALALPISRLLLTVGRAAPCAMAACLPGSGRRELPAATVPVGGGTRVL